MREKKELLLIYQSYFVFALFVSKNCLNKTKYSNYEKL